RRADANADPGHRERKGPSCQWDVHRWCRRVPQRPVHCVGNNTDDGLWQLHVASSPDNELHGTAQRTAAGKVLARERLVDERDWRRGLRIAVAEIASSV